jgi:hypothetical protein
MSDDDWRYIGSDNDDDKKVKAGREYQELEGHVAIIRKAATLLGHYDMEKDTVVTHLEKQLVAKMKKLAPNLNEQILCDGCWGARREGHGESCGRCNGRGTIPVWLRVGANPHRRG